MRAIERLPASSVPPAAVSRVLSRFGRAELAGFITVAIDLLDLADGDPDGDTGDAEDEHLTSHALRYARRGPGCEASDDGDISVTEWHTRGRFKDNPGVHDSRLLHEDDEDADPAGQYDEDYYTGPKPQGYGPGCSISDPPGELEEGT